MQPLQACPLSVPAFVVDKAGIGIRSFNLDADTVDLRGVSQVVLTETYEAEGQGLYTLTLMAGSNSQATSLVTQSQFADFKLRLNQRLVVCVENGDERAVRASEAAKRQ